MILRFIILCALFLFIEFYSYQALRTLIKLRWVLMAYQLISVLLLVFIIYSFTQFDRSVGQTKYTMFTMGLMLLVYVPKIVITLILFGEDIFRIGASILNYFMYNAPRKEMMPDRRRFVSQIALGLAAVPFLSLIYGIFEGKYNFKVFKQTIFFPDLPDAFDGFKITQISDAHSGSFDDSEKINYAIDLINEQESDMILFTGDIVNTHAKEMHPWINAFNRIKEYKYGKFSILGNHDYGEYVTWPSEKQKDENFQEIKNLYGQIGFKLMLNEHTYIQKGNDKMALIGVENWGVNFKKAGDLNKASAEVAQNDFKILMSHDPSHWEAEIKNHPKNFHLTLSGHTHGMQFGIEIPGYFKWSLAQYIYKQWAGLYENLGRYIYVNRGFGFHAYPGRVGIMPEITVIELKKGNNVA
ncbi:MULTISPECIES: metallophosphoesterase [Flavobacterium]|uniref:Phosphoesterase n=1 Tax=Flavobacterium salmonis TaxID=2654844 RepID=A0A6V6YMS8_9FLAO|nr:MULTISPECIES: metallophosphoesterase [Flavobacterium]OOV18223.1 phosphoesterase [Flavobacterium sp. LM4]CAD0000747.1 phosphoesterase [Flavobacterium salmonis]